MLIDVVSGCEVIDSGPISTFGIAYEATLQAAVLVWPPRPPATGKKRMPTPRALFFGSAMNALSAALTTVQRDSPLAGGPLTMSQATPPSGTGQFIEPVMSTMKYRSTWATSPSAEIVAQAWFGSTTEPLPPEPVVEPLPVSIVPLVAPVLESLPLAAAPPTFDSSTFEPQASATKIPRKTGPTCTKRIRET